MGPNLLGIAVVLGLLGVVLAIIALRARWSRGLGRGETVALDNVTLFSERLRLVGRPDRLVKLGDMVIPEEWKSSKRVSEGHRLQLGTYFLLIEEEFGARPPHGFIVLGDGTREKVKNTDALRKEVLAVAEKIREHRRQLEEEIPVSQPPAKCRVCGQRSKCRQSRA
jgi:CRISPR-associated exonuclease Cas4